MNSDQGLMRKTNRTMAKLMIHLSASNQLLCLGNLLLTSVPFVTEYMMKPLNVARLYFGSQFQTCLVHQGGEGKVELLFSVMAGR